MRKGIIRLEIFAPTARGCKPEHVERYYALGTDGKDRVFDDRILDGFMRSGRVTREGDTCIQRYKMGGYDCYTKYIFKPLPNNKQ